MKKIILISLIFTVAMTGLKAQDMPNPGANLQTLPAGSFIVPMDNTLQTNDIIGEGKFNLAAYGLIVHLLNNNVKVQWAIRAGKQKDSVDFSTAAEQILPAYTMGGISRNFCGGPFVIFANDTTGVRSLINNFYSAQGLSGFSRPKVFRTVSATTNVDIRYNMAGFKPRAAILTDGGNEKIHVDFMKAAQVPVTNYQAVDALSLSDCFTFASEPHNDKSGPEVDTMVVHVKNFVLSGRNFLAECAAIRTFENNLLGRFHTVNGIHDVNGSLSANLQYPYADLSYYQFEGVYNANSGGSLKNWELNPGPVSSSYNTVTGTGAFSSVVAASYNKLVPGVGGLVFYLGNHDFSANSIQGINGIRLYLNAFLTPAQPASNCLLVLPVRLVNFQGVRNSNVVTLEWKVASNEIADKFILERSFNGSAFSDAGIVLGTDVEGMADYTFSETISAEKVFYRLRMTDKNGTVTYSAVLLFQSKQPAVDEIRIVTNPVKDNLIISFQSAENTPATLSIVDLNGRIVYQQRVKRLKGNNNINIPLSAALHSGMYVLNLSDEQSRNTGRFVIVR